MADEAPMRFLVEETSFELPPSLDVAVVEKHLETFVALVRARHNGAEDVFRWSRLEEIQIRPGMLLCDLLYQQVASLPIDRDVRLVLQEVINRCLHWDERIEEAASALVQIAGQTCTSPTGAVVHRLLSERKGAACLSLGARSGRSGAVPVQVGATTHEVHFVTERAQVCSFYRTLPEVENMDRGAFMENAALAFPDIVFATGLANQFGRFKTPYLEVRSDVTKHLGVLNDHFQSVHREHKDRTDHAIGAYGIDASLERGKTHQNKAAMRQRTVEVDGKSVVCEWHTKIKPHTDRIHFHPGDPEVAGGRLIVGLFTDHLEL